MSYIWDNQKTIDTETCKIIIHKQIEDIALQHWYTNGSTSSMFMIRLFYEAHKLGEILLMSKNSNNTI